jgi:endo-1,4-beta-xylanase
MKTSKTKAGIPALKFRMDGDGRKRDDVADKLAPEAVRERIRTLRQGVLTVKAAPGAPVTVEQTRHEFPFGTAVPDELAEKDPDAMSARDRKNYLKILGENFNYAVHENALKWYDCEIEEGQVDYYTADRIWEFCHELDIPMRGHSIFWEKDKHVMAWLKKLDNDRLRMAVKRRALGVTGHFKGRIHEFDLNNEMVNGEFFRRRLGWGIYSEMAWMAKAGNPDARLFLNDFGILCEGGFNLESYSIQIESFLANGIPVDGIGCQGHAGTNLKAPMSASHVQMTLDALSQYKLPIKITECLFEAEDPAEQAREMYEIFPLYFAHPSVEGILIWGFWGGAHWRPWTALWRKDWSITPQGEAYRDLVFNRWWTKASGKADQAGFFTAQAFFGDYLVTVNGEKKKVSLEKKKKNLEVVFA